MNRWQADRLNLFYVRLGKHSSCKMSADKISYGQSFHRKLDKKALANGQRKSKQHAWFLFLRVKLCAAYINTCSQMYGGCYAACSGFATPTFSPPPCITQPRQEHRFAGTSTSSCESTVCADYINIVVWYTIWRLLCGMLRLHKTKFHATTVSDYNANIHAHSDADDQGCHAD
ncbi:hypothetical protein D0869_08117 [Hortaea werneckii]|nr:hypothetical protein D0869_08117 [Hortaea werneckii]